MRIGADRCGSQREKGAEDGWSGRGWVWGLGAVTSLQAAFYRGFLRAKPLQKPLQRGNGGVTTGRVDAGSREDAKNNEITADW